MTGHLKGHHTVIWVCLHLPCALAVPLGADEAFGFEGIAGRGDQAASVCGALH